MFDFKGRKKLKLKAKRLVSPGVISSLRTIERVQRREGGACTDLAGGEGLSG
jgi:hypothetical protein